MPGGLLEKAIALAALVHGGQTDKGGQPYILHPIRVMLKMGTEAERIVAVLHDVVEDTTITPEKLREEGFSEEIIEAVLSVSRNKGETYDEFIKRASLNTIGRRVKLGDIEDNSDISRIPNPTKKDFERLKKYQKAYVRLNQ